MQPSEQTGDWWRVRFSGTKPGLIASSATSVWPRPVSARGRLIRDLEGAIAVTGCGGEMCLDSRHESRQSDTCCCVRTVRSQTVDHAGTLDASICNGLVRTSRILRPEVVHIEFFCILALMLTTNSPIGVPQHKHLTRSPLQEYVADMDIRISTNTPMTAATEGRVAVLVDIQNVTRDGMPSPAAAKFSQVLLSSVVEVDDAHWMIATGPGSYADVAFAWGAKGRVWCRAGEHGAEEELIERARHEKLVDRFDTIVVCSGDHRFTDLVVEAGREGKRVIVVGWRGSVARRLELAAGRNTVYLDAIIEGLYDFGKGADVA